MEVVPAGPSILDTIFREKFETYKNDPSLFLGDVLRNLEKNLPDTTNILENDQKFVRVRGMVQDDRGSEYVCLACTVEENSQAHLSTMLCRDIMNMGESKVVDFDGQVGRHCYSIVEIPGVHTWMEKIDIQDSRTSNSSLSSMPVEKLDKFIAKFIGDEAEEIPVNTVLEMYGILSSHSLDLNPSEANTNLENVKNLHVLHYNTINCSSMYPEQLSIADLKTTGRSLLKSLTNVFGDDTTAGWILTNLISTTYARPGGMPISFIPLNLVGITDPVKIVDMFQSLVPVKHLPLTSELLSNVAFAPIKNYDKDILEHGELQLPNGTLLIIDETQLPTGSFPVSGFAEANLKVLEEFILEQKLSFDFGFYKIPMDVDVPIVILSSDTSRFLRTPFQVPAITGNVEFTKDEKELELFRQYILVAKSKVRDIIISGDTSDAIQNSFVDMCKELDKTADKSDLLNELLIVCRLMAAGNLREEVLFEDWARSIELERGRKNIMTAWKKLTS
ncbi:unnamed protein product [Auanema sp. JU1783]|nr:unnamed protein product [Auanema sp. JU1783]